MELNLLTAISPIDGRYRNKTEKLADYFSEYALIRYRVKVEIEYFIALCELPLPQVKGVDAKLFGELRNIYINFTEADAQKMVQHIASDPEQLLKALASERLGASEETLANPIVSASSGALSTAVGAAIPILPFFFLHGVEAVIAAAVISLVAHFAVGAAKSLITVRSWWSSGTEMTVVGAIEGAVTYGIGILLGGGGL